MAFKKPLSNLKTSAPIRSSDWRKLKQRIAQTFNLRPEHADLVVPQGLLSVKFVTHLNEQGVAYLASDGDPLWFTVGKASEFLIPTVYTLWKYPVLLPTLFTPASVIPILTGGADLMIPGVISHPDNLRIEQLVSICQYSQSLPDGTVAPPLAVGFMLVDSHSIVDNAKGKAVRVVHTFSDKLWELGSKAQPPAYLVLPELPIESVGVEERTDEDKNQDLVSDLQDLLLGPEIEEAELKADEIQAEIPQPSGDGVDTQSDLPSLTQTEVSSLLRSSLLQAIGSTLSKLPASTFPMPSTTFYTSYILPSRPANNSTPIDIKHSTHKSLTAFLRISEKEGLIRLKEGRGKADSGVLTVLGVTSDHPDVNSHRSYKTLADVGEKRARMEAREAKENNQNSNLAVIELWKPYQDSLPLFTEIKQNTTALYTHFEIKSILNEYVAVKSLVNAQNQQYIDVDDILRPVLPSNKLGDTRALPESLKREDLLAKLIEKMQPWHRLEIIGQEPIVRKGQPKPVSVVVKIRQGRKACTLLTNFEPYLLSADMLAEELRRLCASSTSVTLLPGKSANAGMEVMVQGKQIKAVTEFLISKGIPKKWIESSDLSDKKRK